MESRKSKESLLTQNDYIQLQNSLLWSSYKLDDATLLQAYPLLAMICKEREVIEKIRQSFAVSAPSKQPTLSELTAMASNLCKKLQASCNPANAIPYRLPIIISEFPVHAYAINQAIKQFNALIENHYQNGATLEPHTLTKSYQAIITAIQEQGAHCSPDSLWQLLGMLAGWSSAISRDLFSQYPFLLYPPSACASQAAQQQQPVIQPKKTKKQPKVTKSTIITEHNIESNTPNKIATSDPFIDDYHYNFNGAGLLANETEFVLLNAFGMKVGGHLDAQVKHPPKFIPLEQLYAIINRQLSHRMALPNDENFTAWIQISLAQLGVKYIEQGDDVVANPFITEPVLSLNPQNIGEVLEKNLISVAEQTHTPLEQLKSHYRSDLVGQYLFELLQGFQTNPGQALGIGANFDGTVNLSNASGTYPFKFLQTEMGWAIRFKELSQHRQGPSEAYMNAGRGIQYELQALLTSFDYMTQLKPSEHYEVLYSALIDNIVAELFPHPAYFENAEKRKFRQQHVMQPNAQGEMEIVSYYVPSATGTFFEAKTNIYKQTPLYRQAGTMEVLAFPRDTNCSEDSRACYAGDPLGPLQLQYAQSMHSSTRGNVVYNPVGLDQFVPDFFTGQVVRSQNGDCVPYIGVMPKNFDKQFKLPQELCASFVVRELHSARLMEYCPTFCKTEEIILKKFLPAADKPIPPFPASFTTSTRLAKNHTALTQALAKKDRTFPDCRKKFFSLFQNVIDDLYKAGAGDIYFQSMYSQLLTSEGFFNNPTRANCEKLIRHFTIYKPSCILVTESLSKEYDEKVEYLRTLATYFYPEPTEKLAASIAEMAKSYATALLKTKSIHAYFAEMKKTQKANLSRRQTPGMAYAALKHGGPSETITHDYSEMHDRSFESGYRDPEGNQISKPQRYEKVMDWTIKKVGALLQLMHRYELFAIVFRPFVQPYVQAKELYHQHLRKKSWIAAGIIKGFFWNGIIGGTVRTIKTPFKMLYDAAFWIVTPAKKTTVEENPLSISAAPPNEPSLKIKSLMQSRDHILHLLSSSHAATNNLTLNKIKNDMISQIKKLFEMLCSEFTLAEKNILEAQFKNSFPVFADTEWRQVTHPFDELPQPYNTLFQTYYSEINVDFIRALFRCLTDPCHAQEPESVIKKNKSICKLNNKQTQALAGLMDYYHQLTDESAKKGFLELIQFDGKVQQALGLKDKQLQKIQNWFAHIFDEQFLLSRLFSKKIEHLTESVTPESLHKIIERLPNTKKEWLAHLFTNENTSSYRISDKEQVFLKNCKKAFDQLNQPKQAEIIQLCKKCKPRNDACLSVKDKEQNKWAAFSEREFKHQLLPLDELDGIFAAIKVKLKRSPALLDAKQATIRENHEKLLASVENDLALEAFFNTATELLNSIRTLIKSRKKATQKTYQKAERMLNDFLNITMNAVINARLDHEDIFSADANKKNPLAGSPAIQNWLVRLSQNNFDLRAIINQQVQQSPSLDHALRRNDCIFEIIEQSNGSKRIPKTGVQALVRMRQAHKENPTKTGQVFVQTDSFRLTPKSLTPDMLNHSETMRHAMNGR